MAVATFACGCFWSKQYFFDQLPGVLRTRVGFTGGHVPRVDYRQVCTKTTGHAEAVEVHYAPARITYPELLRAFFAMHDARIDRRGKGGQYRSALFVHSPDQHRAARQYLARLKEGGITVATTIEAAGPFWVASERHQGYCAVRGMTPQPKGRTV